MKKNLLILSALFFLLQPAAGQGTIDPASWDHRMKIEIDHSKVDAELTNFPVAVMLDAGNFDFSQAESDGSDIRFTAADGQTELVFERELHDQAGQQAVYWVRIPTVAPDANTVFYIYYGNESALDKASTDGGVWDTTLRGAVWHMDHIFYDDNWIIPDSRHSNRGYKVSETNPEQSAGIIGNAQFFDGKEDLISVGHNIGDEGINISDALSLSAWVKPGLQEPLLDQVSGAVAAYSLRKLRDDYTGDAIRVRNSADVQADIGFNSNGSIDIDALIAHTGTGTGDHGYIVTWYDQSGNVKDVTQTVQTNQPMIVEDGEVLMSDGRPMVRFNNDFLDGTLNMGSQNPDATLNAVWRQDSDGQSEVPVFIGENVDKEGLSMGYYYQYIDDPFSPIVRRWNNIRLWVGDIIFLDEFNDNLKVQTGTYLNNGTSSEMQVFLDGEASSLKTDANAFDVGAGFDNTPITIGANEDGTDYLQNSFVAEIVVYDKVLTTAEREKFEDNQFKCYGLTSPVIAGKGRDAYQLEYNKDGFVGYINNDTITAPANIGEYQHVVMTYDQSALKLFIDSIEVNSKSLTGSISTNNNPLIIGELFEGVIDEVRVSNTARSADWIGADFLSGSDVFLDFDLSGFDVEHPGVQPAEILFNLIVTNARGTDGLLLNGDILVDITSNQTADNPVYYANANFTDGTAEVQISLQTLGMHDLTIDIDGITDSVVVSGVEVVDAFTWTGTVSDAWSLSDNWDPNIPGENSYIIIPATTNDPVISSGVTVLYVDIQDGALLTIDPDPGSLTLKDGGRLRIESGGSLVSQGVITVDIGGSLEVKPNASLTSNGTLTNNAGEEGLVIESSSQGTGSVILNNSGVQATVERYMEGGGWYVVSPPVSGQSISEFILNDQNDIPYNSSQGYYAITHYDEGDGDNGNWADFYYETETGSLKPGESYLMRRRNAGAMTFKGTLISGTQIVSIVRTSGGWNSIGNPFASSLRVRGTGDDSFLGLNGLLLDPSYAALYVYDHSIERYRIINNSGAGARELDQDYIKPGQGFIVKAADGGGDVQFTTAMRDHQHKDDGIEFKSHKPESEPQKSDSQRWPTVILSISDDIRESSTVITFNENMTEGLDITYDAGLFGADPELQLYTRLAEGDTGVGLAIQCLPDRGFDVMVIPLGVDYSDGGEVTFSTDILSLPENTEAVLEDSELDIFTSLEEEDYTAYLSAGSNGTGRFFLHIKSTLPGLLPGDDDRLLEVFAANREVFINGMVEHGTRANMYDLMGRRVKSVNLDPSETNSFRVDELSRGIYIIHVERNGIIESKRLLIE